MPLVETADETTLRAAILELYALQGAVPTAEGLAKLDAALAATPAGLQTPTARILAAMNAAALLRNEALAGLNVEDARFAYDRTLSPAPLTDADAARLDAILPLIDLPKMVAASELVLRAIERATPEYERAIAAGLAPEGTVFLDPLGAVEIAGTASEQHIANRTLLVDLGGDDWWSNNAGATFPEFVIEAFPGCITTGGLDCTPLSKGRNDDALASIFGRTCSFDGTKAPFVGLAAAEAGRREASNQSTAPSLPAAQRFATSLPGYGRAASDTVEPDTGCLPQDADDVGPWSDDFVNKGILTDGDEHVVAVGLDLAGNDRFAPDRVFNDINDGDNAPGCDTRSMGEAGKLWERNLTAGSAFAGVGILWDTQGDDFYGGRSIAVGTGHVGGVGIVVDQGNGNDDHSAVRFAHGTAFFSAMGVLLDEGGNDRYALENDVPFFNEFEHFIGCDVSTRDGIGRANFNGIAALVDVAGNDVYFTQPHDPSIPGASRDDVTTTQGSTGTRLNIGPYPISEVGALGFGLLWDHEGDDTYNRPGRDDAMFDQKGTFLDE